MNTTVATANAAAQDKDIAAAMDYMGEFAGAGTESITTNEMSTSYLSLVQPGSAGDVNEGDAGTWRNSATGTNFGSSVRVVPLAFRTIWSERQNVAPYATVGRYEPNSIEVDLRNPPAGQRGYPRMFNPKTGYEIQELYMYAVILPDYPEEGVLYFNPTVGSMRACKAWNTQVKAQRLPNGAPAPIFAFSWNLQAELVPNPQNPKEMIAKFTKVSKDILTGKDLFLDYVKPELQNAQKSMLAIAADDEVAE